MPRAIDPVEVAGRSASSRVVFGPHETNLAHHRALSSRQLAYYAERLEGGAGVLVTETASVEEADWPYERAPLASLCAKGWRELAALALAKGALVLAGLGHSGAQGSSAYSQCVLLAPSRVADAASREMPAEIEPDEIDALIVHFADAAALALDAGLDGVEIDAGARSLLRQFHSGITNLRDDAYGADRLLVTRRLLEQVRERIGARAVLALRLSCDELAPWAGVTPEIAASQLEQLADLVDLVTVVRGGPYSADAYRPGAHVEESFNEELSGQMRAALAGRALVCLQGSVVDLARADRALEAGVCDLVEMTRAQIAEPRLVALDRKGERARARPCILCNQSCLVRDARNPIVTCVGEPRSGYETIEPVVEGRDEVALEALVVGGGVAGLECARVLATRGHVVSLFEASDVLGGALRRAALGPGRTRLSMLCDWLEAECRRLGVRIELARVVDLELLDRALARGAHVVLATGSEARPPHADADVAGVLQLDALSLLERAIATVSAGPVVVDDPIGGPIGVGVAEWLAAEGRAVTIVTQDPVVGTALSRTGDLAAANSRLQRAGVERALRSRVLEVRDGAVVLEHVLTGERRSVPCAALVDAGHRLAHRPLGEARPSLLVAGDAVAPRSVLEAVLEGRRRAFELVAAASAGRGAPFTAQNPDAALVGEP